MRRTLGVAAALLCAAGAAHAGFSIAPAPGVDPARFQIHELAAGLPYPTSLVELDDGSLLVLTNDPTGGGPFDSTGEVLRIVDADDDGAADGPPQLLYTGLPGIATSMVRLGGLVAVSSKAFDDEQIAFLRLGAAPGDPLALAGAIDFQFPPYVSGSHRNVALAAAPDGAGGWHLYWNLGSEDDNLATTGSAAGAGLLAGLPGAAAMAMDGIYRVGVADTGGAPVLSGLERIAAGVRNAAGIAIHPDTGNLWFQDNGMNSAPRSADELNRIAAADLGGAVEDFGFPTGYVEYETGTVFGGGIQPLVAFQPIPDPMTGARSEGPVELVFAPPGFPAPLRGGLFLGFHGDFNQGGAANDENPLVWIDPASGDWLHFVANTEPDVGHPNGLLATGDRLYVADLASSGTVTSSASTGRLYRIRALEPVPALPGPAWGALAAAGLLAAAAMRRRGRRRAGTAFLAVGGLAAGATAAEAGIDPDLQARFEREFGANLDWRPGLLLAPSFADADGDGDLDVPRFLNEGDGTFTNIPGFDALLQDNSFHGSSWADYDADGDPDLVLLGYGADQRSFLLRNDGDAGFVDVTAEAGVLTVGFGETPAWGDYDGDGDVDLYAPYYSHVPPFRSFLYENQGDGTFLERAEEAGVDLPGLPVELRPEGAHWADFDDDGDLDLLCAHHLFENDGEGGFVDVAGPLGLPVTFDEGTEFVDFDADGDLDIYLKTPSGGLAFRNVDGAFTDVSDELGIPSAGFKWGDRWADFDHDGDLDLLFFRDDEPTLLLLNEGGGLVEDPIFTESGFRLETAAVGDVDADGDLDIVAGTRSKQIWKNQLDQSAAFPGSWLRVRVLDDHGHQTMHGATVRLARVDVLDGAIQTRVVDGGSGYLTQSQYDVHFGVSPFGTYAIEVSFPSHPDARILVDGRTDSRLDDLRSGQVPDATVRVYRDGRVRLPEPAGAALSAASLLSLATLRGARAAARTPRPR